MNYFEEQYQQVKEAVEAVVPDLPENWLHCKSYESTLARAVLIRHLELKGFSRRMTIFYTTLAKSTVKQHLNGYNERVKTDKLLRILTAHVGNKLKASEG